MEINSENKNYWDVQKGNNFNSSSVICINDRLVVVWIEKMPCPFILNWQLMMDSPNVEAFYSMIWQRLHRGNNILCMYHV